MFPRHEVHLLRAMAVALRFDFYDVFEVSWL